MMKLPFLSKDKWPTIRDDEERTVNPSYDTQLDESLTDDFFMSMESGNPEHKRAALLALIQHLRSQSNEM